MSVDGMMKLYTKRDTLLDWTTPTSYLYLPTQKAMQLFSVSLYVEDGFAAAAADFDFAIEVKLERFSGATYSPGGGTWSGGAWTTLAVLDLSFQYLYTTGVGIARWYDELKPEGLFRTEIEAAPDPTLKGTLRMQNTHSATPVANETDLRVALSIDPATGISTGTEFGVDVKCMMGG